MCPAAPCACPFVDAIPTAFGFIGHRILPQIPRAQTGASPPSHRALPRLADRKDQTTAARSTRAVWCPTARADDRGPRRCSAAQSTRVTSVTERRPPSRANTAPGESLWLSCHTSRSPMSAARSSRTPASKRSNTSSCQYSTIAAKINYFAELS